MSPVNLYMLYIALYIVQSIGVVLYSRYDSDEVIIDLNQSFCDRYTVGLEWKNTLIAESVLA